MGFFDRTDFSPADPDLKTLISIFARAYETPVKAQVAAARAGLAKADVAWNESMSVVWRNAITTLAQRRAQWTLVEEAMNDPDVSGFLPEFEEFLTRPGVAMTARGSAAVVDHTQVRLIGRRPFVDRDPVKRRIRELAGEGGFDDHVLLINGGADSGRSWTWHLISYYGRRTHRFKARLVDLCRWERPEEIRPIDIAQELAGQLRWDIGEIDVTAQPETQVRVLLSKMKGWASDCSESLWLVFDGLDLEQLQRPVVRLVAEIAAAAGNGELGEIRVVLLGLESAPPDLDFDTYAIREVLTGVPVDELRTYLQAVARDGGHVLKPDRIDALVRAVTGDPPPDLVPIQILDEDFAIVVQSLAVR